MKTIIKTSITETITYEISEDIHYIKVIKDGVEESRRLILVNQPPFAIQYALKPLYDKDLSALESTNPHWHHTGYEDWLDEILPEPEDIDISKIAFRQPASHKFFDKNFQPLPVVRKLKHECLLNDALYNLHELGIHLSQLPLVKQVTNIEVRWAEEYNNYLDILVLPTVEDLLIEQEMCKTIYHYDHIIESDALGLKPFLK